MSEKLPSVLSPAVSDPALEMSGADLFWEMHWKKFAWGLAALVILILVAGIWSWRAAAVRSSAEALYSVADDAEGWREVIARYPGSVPAGNAQIRWSELLRSNGDLAGAAALLEDLLASQPAHPLAGVASLTLGELKQMQGDEAAALEVFRAAGGRYAASFAGPLAQLAEARLLVGRGQTGEARAILESVTSLHPGTPAAMVAAGELEALGRSASPAVEEAGSGVE